MIYKSKYGVVYYEDHGQMNSPVLVFTHGIIMDHKTYADQVSFFSKNYRVIVWDMPGHGLSVIDDENFNFSMVAESLIGLLDEIKVESVTLIGLSLGGLINQYIAYHFPERVSSVVVIGSNPLHSQRNSIDKFIQKVAWGLVLGISTLIPNKTLAKINSKGKAIKPHTMDYLTQLAYTAGKKKMIGYTKATLNGVMEGIEKPISQPLLISHGDKEVSFNIKQAIKWHKQIPQSKYVVISDAGHVANQDNPKVYNEILQKFLLDTYKINA